ncbi:MAG TPA: hypothetical protein VN222_00310 [Novosphingobium sp.]|nr:hypothetical protein [Novosphingobium sp.]
MRAGARQSAIAALMLAAALALRCATFGNPNLGIDDQFYLLVGQRMHEGLLPYVDVWDRKPIGLFLIYWLIAFLPSPVLAYQLAATGCAAVTGWVVQRIVLRLTGAQGAAVMAGLAYVALLGPFDGFGGQAPVFYNLPMALAALSVVQGDGALAQGRVLGRVWGAMALCGAAIAIKQTAAFEAAFLGLWSAVALWRSGARTGRVALVVAGWMALGVGPFVLAGLAYALGGHGAAWWQAMVLANLHKAPFPPGQLAHQAIAVGLRIAPLLALAVWGCWRASWQLGGRMALFGGLWLGAALVGFVAVPNFFIHYALPLLVPACVLAGAAFAGSGRLAFVALMLWCWLWYDPADFAWNRNAAASMRALAGDVAAHDHGGGLLVFDGPVWLYAMTGRPFLSPLVFPHHLNHAIERNVSQFDTDREIDRILARRPGAVVMSVWVRNLPANAYATARVRDYVARNCRWSHPVMLYEQLVQVPMRVYGECRAPG